MFVAMMMVGCQDGPPAPPSEAPPRPTLSPAAVTSIEARSPSPIAPAGLPSADVATGADAAGRWVGRFVAKKGSLGSADKGRDTADRGTASAGKGEIKLTVAGEGEVRGTMSGALGEGVLKGRFDGGMVRLSVYPVDPSAVHAMTGVLIAIIKGDNLEAQLRVASPDASLIREAVFILERDREPPTPSPR